MFYEGICLPCATRAVTRVSTEQVEMRTDPALFRPVRIATRLAGVA